MLMNLKYVRAALAIICIYAQCTFTKTHLRSELNELTNPYRSQFDSRFVCDRYSGLTTEQTSFCRRHPGVTLAALTGVRWSMQECSYQFREERWNCSNLMEQQFPFRHRFLKRGYRESAAAQAFLSAGIFTEISKLCINGDLPKCHWSRGTMMAATTTTKKIRIKRTTRTSRMMARNGTAVIHSYRHQDSLLFADVMTERFLKSASGPRDASWHIRNHNFKVGREMVKENLREQCHCHGFSASCEIKSCWSVTAPLRDVARKIKQKYDLAVMIDPSVLKIGWRSKKCRRRKLLERSRDEPFRHRGKHFFVSWKGRVENATRRNTTKTTKEKEEEKKKKKKMKKMKRARLPRLELVYSEESPDYCVPNSLLGLSGTSQRTCNLTGDNCRKLCCGRGFETNWRAEKVRCRCRFKWCCEVVCETCFAQRKHGLCH